MNAKTLMAIIVAAGMVFGQTGLAGSQWNLQKLNHSSTNIAGYTLRFIADSTAAAHMQCNSCGYRYSASASALSFTQGMCTLAACLINTRENEFTTALSNVTGWKRDGTRLLLMGTADTLMEYLEASTPVLSGKVGPAGSGLFKTAYSVIVVGHVVVVTGPTGVAFRARLFDIRGTCVAASVAGGPVSLNTQGLSKGMFMLRVAPASGAGAQVTLNLVK
jgi:heat shock protein HslJ